MVRRARKRPPLAIQRVNRLLSRIELATALEVTADGDQDALDLAKLLRSQESQTLRCTPHTLAQKIGIPYSRVIKLFQESKRLETVVVVAQQMPEIGHGIAEDAKSKQVMCETCAGEGKVKVEQQEKTCVPCEGSGKVLKSGNATARKQVLEMMGLAGANATPIHAPGANILIAGGESLESTLRAAKGAGGGAGVVHPREAEVAHPTIGAPVQAEGK